MPGTKNPSKNKPAKTVRPRIKTVSNLPAQPLTLCQHIEASVAAASWLGATDRASVELALKIARALEALPADPETLKALTGLIATLARVLNDLGLTSKGRPQAGASTEGESWLDELRQANLRKR